MDAATLQQALDDVYDQAIVYHAYTDYLRDYEVIIDATVDLKTGIPPAHLRYLFRYCAQATVETALSAHIWRDSLDDRLLDPAAVEAAGGLVGYVWAVKYQALDPGARVVPDSASAQEWADALGMDFYEVRIETNVHKIALVFSDLQVTELPRGYAPFVVGDDAGQQTPSPHPDDHWPAGAP